jgi:hypothetical protein
VSRPIFKQPIFKQPIFRHTRRAALALALLATLAACGKEGQPGAPEGEEANYTYPQVYPKPSSVVPEDAEALKSGEVPAHAGGISVVPSNSRSKTTYDSGPVQ